jgi:hypothetical protein
MKTVAVMRAVAIVISPPSRSGHMSTRELNGPLDAGSTDRQGKMSLLNFIAIAIICVSSGLSTKLASTAGILAMQRVAIDPMHQNVEVRRLLRSFR